MNTLDDIQAFKEGWGIFNDNEIQRLDHPSETGIEGLPEDPVFESDEAAVSFVLKKAAQGSAFHKEAIRKAARI